MTRYSVAENELVRQLMENILERAIKINAAVLAPIIAVGGIGVVLYHPSQLGEDAARSLGWDGDATAFRMSAVGRKRMIRNLEGIGDEVTVRWLRGTRTGRIFVIAMSGTLLVNFEQSVGYSLEPGSTKRASA